MTDRREQIENHLREEFENSVEERVNAELESTRDEREGVLREKYEEQLPGNSTPPSTTRSRNGLRVPVTSGRTLLVSKLKNACAKNSRTSWKRRLMPGLSRSRPRPDVTD